MCAQESYYHRRHRILYDMTGLPQGRFADDSEDGNQDTAEGEQEIDICRLHNPDACALVLE
jgi:hypothetical protein